MWPACARCWALPHHYLVLFLFPHTPLQPSHLQPLLPLTPVLTGAPPPPGAGTADADGGSGGGVDCGRFSGIDDAVIGGNGGSGDGVNCSSVGGGRGDDGGGICGSRDVGCGACSGRGGKGWYSPPSS